MNKLLRNLLGHLAPRFYPVAAANADVDQSRGADARAEVEPQFMPTSGDMLVECLRGGSLRQGFPDARHVFPRTRAGREADLRFEMTLAGSRLV